MIIQPCPTRKITIKISCRACLKLLSFARPYLVLLASTVNGYEGQAKIAKGLQMDVRLVYIWL